MDLRRTGRTCATAVWTTLVGGLVLAGCSAAGDSPRATPTTALPTTSSTSTVPVTTSAGPSTTAAGPVAAPTTTTTTARPAGGASSTTSTVRAGSGATGAEPTSPVTTRAGAPLFGVPLGTEAEGAITRLAAALGPPKEDTGWNVGCPLDHPTDANERLVSWQHLRVLFIRPGSTGAGTLRGYGFVLPEGDRFETGDAALRLALPAGVTLGAPIAQVATAVGAPARVDTTFGWVAVTTPGAVFTADGTTTSAPLNAVSVPTIFSCE